MSKTLSLASAVLSALHPPVGEDADRQAAIHVLIAHDAVFTPTLQTTLNGTAPNKYASHSSHSSHASHASHASGSGASYQYRPPAGTIDYVPNSPASPATPATPAALPLKPAPPPKPTADQLERIIMRVQAALYSKGYDPGAIDGVLTDATKAALRKFQTDRGIKPSGKLTTETLNALGVSVGQ